MKLDIEKSINKLSTFDGNESPVPDVETENQEAPSGKNLNQRKRRLINKCPHTDRKHYAKNMCHNCYHRKGKTKMATVCGHTERSHYSSGMCQNCYLAKYYIKRKDKMAQKGTSKSNESESHSPLKAEENSTNMGDDLEGSAKRQKLD